MEEEVSASTTASAGSASAGSASAGSTSAGASTASNPADEDMARWKKCCQEKVDEARRLKNEGASAFKAGDWATARQRYEKAAFWVEELDNFEHEVHRAAGFELLAACLLNCAQCSLKMGDWTNAEKSCTTALALTGLPAPSRAKAYFRRGSARTKLSEFDDARRDYKEACTLEPKSSEIRAAFAAMKQVRAGRGWMPLCLAATACFD